MAYVVRRPGGRWEIRESYATAAGPRARTLATFRTLSRDVIDRAARAARTRFDPYDLARSAKRAGVPVEAAPADAGAAALLRALSRGGHVRAGLRRLLIEHLESERPPDDEIAGWIGASLEERGAALIDLLGLADRLPKPRRALLAFPSLSPSRLR